MRPLFYGHILAGYSFATLFLASCFFLHSRGIFFPIWMEEFAVDRTRISLVVSLVLFTGALLAPFIGNVLDRVPARRVISVGLIWLAVGYGCMQLADSFIVFMAIMLLFQSVGWECAGPLSQTKLMVNWFSRNRGMALGIAIMGISVAGVVMPTLAAFLAATFGWRDTYLIYAAVLLLVMLPITLLVVKQQPSDIGTWPDGDAAPEDPRPTADTVESEQGLVATYREFLLSKGFWSVVITFGLMNGVYSAMMTHVPTFMTRELDYSIYEASYVLGIAGGFAIGGKVVYGWLMDHFDARRTVLSAISAYFISIVVFVTADNFWLYMLGGALFGLGFGGMVPVRSVLLSRMFGVRKFSRVNGLLSFFLAPAMFWVLITGYIADATGTYLTAFYVWGGAFLLAGMVSAIVHLPNPDEAVA